MGTKIDTSMYRICVTHVYLFGLGLFCKMCNILAETYWCVDFTSNLSCYDIQIDFNKYYSPFYTSNKQKESLRRNSIPNQYWAWFVCYLNVSKNDISILKQNCLRNLKWHQNVNRPISSKILIRTLFFMFWSITQKLLGLLELNDILSLPDNLLQDNHIFFFLFKKGSNVCIHFNTKIRHIDQWMTKLGKESSKNKWVSIESRIFKRNGFQRNMSQIVPYWLPLKSHHSDICF